ncbi:type I DNA topoisomerase [Petroclostridium sp. X23]|uniref:type I DNA topoisomerase n=1 Tax=Petroclostridium sp. X23 TaxID=3045146 RepID=UPI0024AC99F9|nr:type I DNA topoisomerase [Petroclostridium sp. X23]WHH58925.1 type I DNA topoisomerase [Petroclostridium sp. X23]
MSGYLVIVESPAKAKTIKKYLGRNYKVLASMGHLRDLPKSQMGVDIEHDFEPKYITIRGKGDLLSELKKEAKGSDKVYLATDPDREGEAISWHLAKALDIKENQKCRIVFNEITKSAVQNAIKIPRVIDDKLVNAQQARRILDRIVGYKISPLLWKKVRKGLSAGRVQSVATRLICDREEEINIFVPKEYWSIAAKMQGDKSRETFEAKFYGSKQGKIELNNKEEVEKILALIKKASYIVSQVKKGERKRTPAPPFITSTLQQEASRKLGFTAKRTMMAAQQLYEGIEIKGKGTIGLITYMRTDSTRIAAEAQNSARDYIKDKYGQEYVPQNARQYKTKKGSQDAHEAIRPTDVLLEPLVIKESLKPDQYKLYKLIWERYVASQMKSAVYDTLSIDIEADQYIFKANGSRIKFQGFMILYVEGKDDEGDEEEGLLPELVEGQKLNLKKLDPKQHFTQPPPRYTEATLIKALEEKGIGRPSTYAPTITTILARGYIEREKRQLKPTELGTIITDIMKEHFKDIVDVEFTANMEQQLDEVEEGQKEWVEVLKQFYTPFEETLKEAEEEIGDIEIQDEVTEEKCEKCGRNMVIKHGRYGKFLACPGFPECRNAKPILEEAGVNCPVCGGKVYIKKTRKGRKYFGCEHNPKCEFMTWDEPIKESCPQCDGLLVKKVSKKKQVIHCTNKNCEYERSMDK